MTSLNPVLTIGTQIVETLQAHLDMDAPAARRRGVELLAAVGIPAPERRLRQYPHELSGGMRQRVAIAIALACEPKLLIADEPTTALDVTVQAQILDLLAREQRRRNMAMILITHDLGVVAGRTDEIAVMYAGRVVERAPTRALFAPHADALHRGAAGGDPEARAAAAHAADRDPRPPARPDAAAAGLLVRAALPATPTSTLPRAPSRRSLRSRRVPSRARCCRLLDGRHRAMRASATAAARRGSRGRVPVGGRTPVSACRGVSFDVGRGETLGLVGESRLRQVAPSAARSCSCAARPAARWCSRAPSSPRCAARRCARCAAACR